MKEFYPENLKFDSPLRQEQKRQSKKTADKWCRHLWPLEEIRIIVGDGYETFTGCSQCHRLLLPEEIEKRNKTLIKFNNLKKI